MKISLPVTLPSKHKFSGLGLLSRSIAIGSLAILVQGCATNIANNDVSSSALLVAEKATEQSADKTERKKNMISEHLLTSEQMFMLLRAELLEKRGDASDAFDIYYQLADETRDPEISQRAFSLSMATYQVSNMVQTASLWREVDPKNPLVWRASFVLSLRAGNVDAAVEQWQKYASLSETSIDQDILLAAKRISSSMVGNSQNSVEFIQKIAALYPQEWASYLGLGIVATAKQFYPQAVDALKKSLTFGEFKQRKDVYELLAKLYIKMELYKDGVTQFSIYQTQHPDDLELQELLARLELQAGDQEQAEDHYQQIVDANPNKYSARYALALLKLETKQFQQAITLLQPLLEIEQFENVAHYYQGYAYQGLKQIDQALKSFQQVQGQPYSVDAKLHIAELKHALGQTAETYEVLDSITSSDPVVQKKVFLAKSVFYRIDKRYQESAEALGELLKIDPENERALLEQGNLYYLLDRQDDYVANMKRLLVLNPDNVNALNGLGYYYAEHNIKLAEAKQLVERALELKPDGFFILDSMGWVYYQLKDYKQAIAYLEKAYRISEDDVVVKHLIYAYWKAGLKSQAEALWHKYNELMQTKPVSKNIQEWIQEGE